MLRSAHVQGRRSFWKLAGLLKQVRSQDRKRNLRQKRSHLLALNQSRNSQPVKWVILRAATDTPMKARPSVHTSFVLSHAATVTFGQPGL
jgi:hypothetical protein